jgi:hypothetical protein
MFTYSYRKADIATAGPPHTGFGPKKKTPTSLEQKMRTTDKRNSQKVYAGYVG